VEKGKGKGLGLKKGKGGGVRVRKGKGKRVRVNLLFATVECHMTHTKPVGLRGGYRRSVICPPVHPSYRPNFCSTASGSILSVR